MPNQNPACRVRAIKRPVVLRNSGFDSVHEASRFLPVWPDDLRDRTLAGREKLIAIIERELRKERRRGNAGDRAYDIMRHAKLVRLLKVERQSFLTLACLRLRTAACGDRKKRASSA
jgi:hypothetical protein